MIKWLSLNSKAIANFPMNDPTERSFPVMLPPHYDSARSDGYPCIYLLPGYGTAPGNFAYSNSVFDPCIAELFTQAMLARTMPDAIVVFVNATSKFGGSQYINSPAFGHYMDYLCDEVIDCVDTELHTIANRDYRAITGHSSGGYGAMMTSMMRADCFSYCASSAGDCFFEALFFPMITPTMIAIEAAGGIEAFATRFLDYSQPGKRSNFEAMMMLAMAPCFAPNLEQPFLLGDLFFDLNDGHIKDDIWQKYLSWDPVHCVKDHLENLSQLAYIRLDCGLADPYGMQWGQRQIHQTLTKHHIQSTLNEYPGTHSGQRIRFVERTTDMLNKMMQP